MLLIFSFSLHPILVSSDVPSGSEQSVPAPTSADQPLQEPPRYLEEEEEEIYISEAMQEITDGNFVSKTLSCDFCQTLGFTQWF